MKGTVIKTDKAPAPGGWYSQAYRAGNLIDLNQGRITQEEAYRYLKSLWSLIENRRTTVNGRIDLGGSPDCAQVRAG